MLTQKGYEYCYRKQILKTVPTLIILLMLLKILSSKFVSCKARTTSLADSDIPQKDYKGMQMTQKIIFAAFPGWVVLDRSGRHFGLVLNFLRDGSVPLPEDHRELEEVLKEAQYYRVQGLIQHCLSAMQVNR